MSPGRQAFTLSALDNGVAVLTVCRSCGTFKTLDLDVLPVAARALRLRDLEAKVVCQWRGHDWTNRPCGGRVSFSLDGVRAGRSPLRDYDYGSA